VSKDLLGHPISPTPAMTDPLPMRVFAMNDCDWWMARSLEEAKADYCHQTGSTESELCPEARELTDAELDRLRITDLDDNERPSGKSRSFRKELQRRVDAGITKPEMFASTEY
jgi:hypothetical protein